MRLIFATHNTHKFQEIKPLVPQSFELISLQDIGWKKPISETEDSLQGNALLKARTIYTETGISVFADDTGLEVEALNGAPGVFSARYAGVEGNAQKNMEKLLCEMKGVKNRKAQFRTVIALIINDREWIFEGIAKGSILQQKSGDGGFGYDPIFQPEGLTKTFASLSSVEKNEISHRGKAMEKCLAFLNHF